MRISGIYKIINIVNGKYYVGSSKDIIDYRWPKHYVALNNNRHKNDYLQNAWNKHGKLNFEIQIVEEVSDETKLRIVEQEYLSIAKTEQHKCYNLNFDAKGGSISEYSKMKIGNFHRGKIIPIETRQKISKSTKKSMNTIEMFNRMSLARRDKIVYKFVNIKTSECFSGTRKEFCLKYDFNKVIPYFLINKKRKQHKGWILDSNNFTI